MFYLPHRNQSASLHLTYSLVEGSQQSPERTVVLRPAIVNRLRGLFWGLMGLLFSIALTILVGYYIPPKQLKPDGSSTKTNDRWHYVLGIALGPENRYSVSALQVVIWTHLAAYSIAYVWTMTGQVVQITPQLLELLGIGGITAVLSRFATSSNVFIPEEFFGLLGKDRTPKLRDLVTSGDAPSIFKFQMLVFTVISASIVAWEVTRSYVFPNLPNELVLLMGISNATYMLGNATVNAERKTLWSEVEKNIAEIESRIKEQATVWSRSSVVKTYLENPSALDSAPGGMEVRTLLQRLQEQLQRLFA